MSALQSSIAELQEYELLSIENGSFTNMLSIDEAIDILERFEVNLINELTCEQLELKKNGFKYIS